MYEEERRVREQRIDDPTVPVNYVREERVAADDGVAPAGSVNYVRHERVVADDGMDGIVTRQIIASRVAHTIWTIIGFIEALIAIRVILKLIGANAGNGFVNFIYGFSDFFVKPFLGIVTDPTSGKSILEINSLIAMLVYLLIGWVVVRLVWLVYDVTAPTRSSI